MTFLLTAIDSKFIHSNPAVYSLKSFVHSSGFTGMEIDISSFTINQMTEDIVSEIYRKKPDYIGISCYIWNIGTVREILPTLHTILPNTGIFLGGPEVSFCPEEIMKAFPFLKGIFIGEGEETFLETVTFLAEKRNEDLPLINGLYTKEGFTPRNELSLENIPFFYNDYDINKEFGNKIIYYESSRGCPYKCSYCLSSAGGSLRMRPLSLVFSELSFFLAKKVKQVKFVDRTFNADKEHAISIWKYLKEHDNSVTNFHFEIAADTIDDEEISLLSSMRPGLVQLEIGVQTANPDTLRAIHRNPDLSQIRKVSSAIIKGRNVHVHLDLIAGLPHEDYSSFKNSFNEVYNMKPDQLQLGFLKVLKGTEIDKRKEEYGLRFIATPPYEVLSTNLLSYGDICLLKDISKVLEDYYNSAQFTKTLPILTALYDTPFDFYERLAKFYRENGYFIVTPARSRRYEILLDYVQRYHGEVCESVLDSLTIDYYLREKPKAKPAFVQIVPPLSLIDYTSKDPITGNFRLCENS